MKTLFVLIVILLFCFLMYTYTKLNLFLVSFAPLFVILLVKITLEK